MSDADAEFERLVDDAERAPFIGWDFRYLHGRLIEQPTSWDYADVVRRNTTGVRTMLDHDTGDGRRLADLAPLPGLTVATRPGSVGGPPGAVRPAWPGLPGGPPGAGGARSGRRGPAYPAAPSC